MRREVHEVGFPSKNLQISRKEVTTTPTTTETTGYFSDLTDFDIGPPIVRTAPRFAQLVTSKQNQVFRPSNRGQSAVHEVQIQSSQLNLHPNNVERSRSANGPAKVDDIDSAVTFSDLWSSAYREAVENLREELDITILKGKSVAQLFEKLEEIDKDVTHESAFVRGVKYLHSMQKLALDSASPLANLEAFATTVVGELRSVTAIAISVAAADVEFGKQIAEMLKRISYIDDCDTLGQKADNKDIHKVIILRTVS
ncbi:hypothetical protein TSTA_033780 [Talaromyces stipitatus ATCC 10500]|uniref:Uncharacterized protein n=1 Tax=Talaromyces stipitatus (strain ATCC 10500 / CBS 375.48 / QM 6759 / NRRL 1006) TaxID=441959 RepID=B8M6R6_TALSN|nr:uncharacterized protein TSTA_033780 [Talaromyces stipitatus ATCC 10500]EED20136.1 hypothetical protein TSTA_033780 [Talaromyces stipitatus ATCC 10500]